MKIEQIVLENFGPFIGRQTIDFRTSGNTPLVVIHAENGRGKTFLYRAIRWALYGRVTKESKPIPEGQLVNSLGLSRGDAQMSVTLQCVSNDENLEIIRSLPIDRDSRLPTSSKLTIVKDGITLTPSGSEELISARLDQGISRFFFFDGEMLKEYETLLDQDDGDVQVVRNSIEAILGAPALSRLEKVLEAIERTTMKQIEASTKADLNLQKLAKALATADERVRGIEVDLQSMRLSASEFQKDLRQIEDELKNFEYTREIITTIETKRIEKTRHEESANRAREEIRRGLQIWEIGMSYVASKALEIVEPIREGVYAAVSERGRLNNRLENIRDSSLNGTCSVCHQSVSSEAASKLEIEMAEIQGQLLKIPIHEQSHVRRLDRIVSTAKKANCVVDRASLLQIGRALELALQNAATVGSEIERLQELIGNVDEPSIKRLEAQRSDLNAKIAVTQASIKNKNSELLTARSEQDRCKRELQEETRKNVKKGIAPSHDLSLPIQINEVASAAHRVVRDSYDEFVQRMRDSVSTAANAIFKSLISDSGYKGLMINKNFGLSLLNEDERVVDLRSSGQSQVVAVSLILALHECAVRSGTLLMDTPFGRLDVTHRKNMMNYFTTQLPQVILLIQSGELDDDDLSAWAPYTAHRYRLARGGSTAETYVEEF